MPLPSGYTVNEVHDTFTEASDTGIASHTPDVDTSAGGYTAGTGSLTVIGASDLARGTTSNNDNEGLLNGFAISGDFLAYCDVDCSGSPSLGVQITWGPLHFHLTGVSGAKFGLDYSVNGSKVVLWYESASDTYTEATVYTLTSGDLTTPQQYAIERVGDTLRAYIAGTLSGTTLSLAGTTDFAGGPSCKPVLNSGNFNGASVWPQIDNYYVYTPTPGGGGTAVPVFSHHYRQQGL